MVELKKNLPLSEKILAAINFFLNFLKILSVLFLHDFKVKPLNMQTSASLKFTVLNPKGRIWTMVAGGGASVIYADTVNISSFTLMKIFATSFRSSVFLKFSC